MLAGGKEVKKVKVVIKTDEYGTEQHTGGTVEMWSDLGEDSTHDFGDGLNLVGDFRGNKTAAIDIKLRDSRILHDGTCSRDRIRPTGRVKVRRAWIITGHKKSAPCRKH